MGDLSSRDRDAMIRTVMTEARGGDALGQAAVASVIRNRLAKGTYGDSPSQIVTAPYQFEPWQRGTAQRVDPSSPEYEAAGRIVDAVANGLPDPTNGATHFYAPVAQAALGRAAPKWGAGQPMAQIGGHNFYAPQGAVTFSGADDAPAQIAAVAPSTADDDPKARPKSGEALDKENPPANYQPQGSIISDGQGGLFDANNVRVGHYDKVGGHYRAPVWERGPLAGKPADAGSETPAMTLEQARAAEGEGSDPAPTPSMNEAKTVASDDPFSRWKIGGDDKAAIDAPSAAPAAADDPFSRWNIAKDATPVAAPQPSGVSDPKTGLPVSVDAKGIVTTYDKSGNPQQSFLPEDWTRYKSQVSAASPAGAFAGNALNAIPGVGPAVKSGVENAAAAVRSLANDTPFSTEKANIEKIAANDVQNSPKAALAGNIAGPTVALIGAGGVPVLARGLGMAGGSLGGQMLAGAGGNALLGGVDAAARGESIKTGAGFGAAGGAAGPVIGKAIGAGFSAASNALTNYLAPTGVAGLSRPAANMLTTLIQQEGPQNVQAELSRLGQNGMLADAGPSLQSITGALAGKPDAAQPIVVNALTGRAGGANARLGSDINAALGPAPVPSQVLAGVKSGMEGLGPEYQQAYAGASAVNTNPLANQLEAQSVNLRGPARDALTKVRGYLNIPGTQELDPNPQALHATREAIDGLLANEQNPQVIRQLTIARQGVDGQLAQAVPGIKAADAQYAELARQGEALKAGSSVLDSGKTAVHPEDFARAFPASAIPQGELVGPSAVPLRTQQGVRAEVNRLVGTKANDLSALKTALQGEGGWNTAKLATAFGEDNTNKLLGAVDRERTFANTNNLAAGNSKTNLMNQGNKLLDAADPQAGFSLLPTTAVGASLAAGKWALGKSMNALMQSSSEPMRVELARALTDTSPGAAQRLQQIIALAQRQGSVSAGGAAFGAAAGRAANALTIGAVNSQRNSFLSK